MHVHYDMHVLIVVWRGCTSVFDTDPRKRFDLRSRGREQELIKGSAFHRQMRSPDPDSRESGDD